MFDWNCPYATTSRLMPNYLFCEKRKKQGVNYNDHQALVSVFCCCQRYCTTQRKPVTTGNAKECYDKTNKEF